jgi:hypothetical protein
MLQAHSPLWHYLWISPNVLLLVLGFFLWKQRKHRLYPVFFAFTIVGALEQLAIYVADVAPTVTPAAWWRVFWIGLLAEGLLKFCLIGEILAHAFFAYTSIAKLGKLLVGGVGAALVFAAAIAAARAPYDSRFGIVSGAHLLQQTIYITETGLLVLIFLFAAYFRIRLSRATFGIAIGLGVSACIHLATWAIASNGGLPDSNRVVLDFVNMATYHACVLIWFYFLLVPPKAAKKSAVSLPENNLALWNRELERLLHS